MRSLVAVLALSTSALAAPAGEATAPAPEAAPAATAAPEAPAAAAAAGVTAQPAPAPAVEPLLCPASASEAGAALPDGPVALGYAEGDMATGRRVCARTEVGFGGRLGAIIDTPAFYGDIAGGAVLFASYALKPRLELFATLEPATFTYTQNATLKQTQLAFGNLTAGATRGLYQTERFAGALSGRVLLPTSFEVPNSRVVGLELGHASKWVATSWLRVHTYLGADVTTGLGSGPALTRAGGTLLLGAELVPTSWFAFVVDVTGHLGGTTSYLAPTAALRFRASKLGIELGGTLPVVGTDRHDLIAGLRLSWMI